MTPRQLKKLERELEAYTGFLTVDMGRPERRQAMGQYVAGLLLDGNRKCIVPMAARLADDPSDISGLRQRLQRCVKSTWRHEDLFARVARKLIAELPAVEAFVVDDTGFAKKGEHSPGVARQYSGTLGRTDNCQVAVSLHVAGDCGSGCVGMRLYLPESWARDRERCERAGIPEDIDYEPKWKLALALIDDTLSLGVRLPIALADSRYGDVGDFRAGLSDRGLLYNVGVKGATVVWRPGLEPKLPKVTPGKNGRPRTTPRMKRSAKPVPIATLAKEIGRKSYRKITWRMGTRGRKSSRFVALRIRTAHGHGNGRAPGDEQWLLCEWPADEKAPTKFFLSNQPASTSLKELVRTAKLRWRVERDYQDLKQEVGLDDFEGRMWHGFHHHAALCAAAHAFLALRRALSPPEERALDAPPGAKSAAAGSPSVVDRVPAVPPHARTAQPALRSIAALNFLTTSQNLNSRARRRDRARPFNADHWSGLFRAGLLTKARGLPPRLRGESLPPSRGEGQDGGANM